MAGNDRPEAPPAAADAASANATTPHAEQRVLVVDDSVATRRLLRVILQAAGHQVLEAADALEAQQVLAVAGVDLILLDVMMPGTSGFELCKLLRGAPRYADIPIILLTALSESRDRIQGLQCGADDFVSKPFDRVELLARSRVLLEKKALADRLRRTAEQLSRANAQLNERVGLMSNLLLLGHQLRGELAPEEVHDAVRVALARVAGAESFSIFQRAAWRGWQLTLWMGLDDKAIPALSSLPALDGVLARVVESRQPYFQRDGKVAFLTLSGMPKALPVLAALPLVADEQLIGVLAVHRYAVSAADEAAEALLSLTAREVAAALYNLSLYNKMLLYANGSPDRETSRSRQRSLEHRLQRLSTLAFFSSQLHTTLDWERVHDLIRRLGVDFVGAERLYVVFHDGQRPSIFLGTVRGLVSGNAATMGVERYAGLIRQVMDSGKPVPRRLGEGAPSSAVAVPLAVGGRTLGAVVVEGLQPELGGWTEQNWELLQLLADQAAPALMTASLYRKMSTLAITDGLTGIFNHRHFHERLTEEWRRAERYHKPLSLIILEADEFKKVNDTYGHLQGDSVLRELAALLKRHTREVDIVARYGGDEFTVILPETDIEGAKRVAERIRQAVYNHEFAGEDSSLRVTVSAGVAARPPILDRNTLVRVADDALYTAKRRGKNQVVIAT
ncbi:MAG: diguanylate cyclase [Chloroflexi bacterium]|nr:diguanylate cyclase [Chloroflexota bacterium]